MKTPVIVVHGGDSFPSYEEYIDYLRNRPVSEDKFRAHSANWKADLAEELGPDFDVFQPRMPNNTNARFDEWVIWFERLFPFLSDPSVLVGHSLGGMFLAKYLSLYRFPQPVKRLCLVAAPFAQRRDTDSFNLPSSLQGVVDQCQAIDIFQSDDDPAVPAVDAADYAAALPGARVIRFTDRGHFLQQDFPELVAAIKGV